MNKIVKPESTDFNVCKEELIDSIELSGFPEQLKSGYLNRINQLDDISGIDSLISKCNADIDKINAGGHIIKSDKTEYGFLILDDDEFKEVSDKIEETNVKISELNEERLNANNERKAKIDAELEDLKRKRSESYETASAIVNTCASNMVDFTKNIISGNPDSMVDAMLTAFAGIFKFLTKGLALGVTAIKSMNDKRKAGEELDDSDIEVLDKAQLEVIPVDGNIGTEPMTEEESTEIEQSMADAEFSEVGKITDWDSAFKYGIAKLKQIHGVNFDQSKAEEVLNGLKAKYPDNPMVVVGALKYGGGHRKAKPNEQENSRKFNSRQLREVRKDFTYVEDALDWLDDFPPGDTYPIAVLTIGNKGAELQYGFDIDDKKTRDSLYLVSMNFDNHHMKLDDNTSRGELCDKIIDLVKEFGEPIHSTNSKSSKIYALWSAVDEGSVEDIAYTGPFDSVEDAKSKLGFRFWTEVGGFKNRISLVTSEYLPGSVYYQHLDSFISRWNAALRGFHESTDEIKTYINMRKSNSKSDKIYAVWELIEFPWVPVINAYTGPFDSIDDAKSKLNFKYWGEKGRHQHHVALVPESEFIIDQRDYLPIDKFIAKWNKAMPDFIVPTSEIRTYLNARRTNSQPHEVKVPVRRTNSMPTSIMDAIKRTGLDISNIVEDADGDSISFEFNGFGFLAQYTPMQYLIVLSNYGTEFEGYIKSANGEVPNAITVSADKLKDGILTLCKVKGINSRRANSDERSKVRELFKELDPDVTDSELDKLVKFGLALAASPKDLIDTLNEKIELNRTGGRRSNGRVSDMILGYAEKITEDNFLDVVAQVAKDAKYKFNAKNVPESARSSFATFMAWAQTHPEVVVDELFMLLEDISMTYGSLVDTRNSRVSNSNMSKRIRELNSRMANSDKYPAPPRSIKEALDRTGLSYRIEDTDEDLGTVFFEYNGSGYMCQYTPLQFLYCLSKLGPNFDSYESSGKVLNSLTVYSGKLKDAIMTLSNTRCTDSRVSNSDTDGDELIKKLLKDSDPSVLMNLPNHSSRYRIKFDSGVGSGKWLKAETIKSLDEVALEYKRRNPIEVSKELKVYLDDSGNRYDRWNEDNDLFEVKDTLTGKIIAKSDGEEARMFNSKIYVEYEDEDGPDQLAGPFESEAEAQEFIESNKARAASGEKFSGTIIHRD